MGLETLSKSAEIAGKLNIAFEAAYLLADVDRCLNILIKSHRLGEAAIFSKSYAPSRLAEVTKLWSD